MIGDKLLIREHHTRAARLILEALAETLAEALDGKIDPEEKFTLSVAGESGAGKSELAFEIMRLLTEGGRKAEILQQDDYFVFPPKTNDRMRRENIHQVGLYEVKLDFLDANLRSFKRGETSLYKPLAVYEEDRLTTEEKDVGNASVLIAEGTYTTRLRFVDCHVFIDRDYRDTEATRQERARDKLDAFIERVLQIEHGIISAQKAMADIVVRKDFSSIWDRGAEAARGRA